MPEYLEIPRPAVEVLDYLERTLNCQRINPFAIQLTAVKKVVSYLVMKPVFNLRG